MARSPEQLTNVPLPTYDADAEVLLDAKAAAKLAEKAHPGLSEANIFSVDVANLDAQETAAAETTALIKEAKAMRAVVARVPLYRDAFGYDSGAQLRDTQRVPLRAAFQIMLRSGSLAQKLKEAQKLMVRGVYDAALNEEIVREIEHIKKHEAIVAAALAEQNIVLPEDPPPPAVPAAVRRTLKVSVPETWPSATETTTVVPTGTELSNTDLTTIEGDKRRTVLVDERTMKASSMSAESLPKQEVANAMSHAEIIRERSEAWSGRVREYKQKLESLKRLTTAAYLESLPEYQAFQKNLQVLEPLLDGSWPEEDAVKSHLLQENMQRLAANVFSIEHTVNERRAAFVASVGAETAAMRDLMDDAYVVTSPVPAAEKKTGWFNPAYREAQTARSTEVPVEIVEAEKMEPLVLTPDMRVESASQPTEVREAPVGEPESTELSDMELVDNAEPAAQPMSEVPQIEVATNALADTYVEPDVKLFAVQESWRTVGHEGPLPEVLKLQELTDTTVALEEQLTNAIVETGYHDPSQPRNELAEQLVAVRNRLKSAMVRVRALSALSADELTSDEVHALEMQVGEVEYGVKRLIQKEAPAPEAAPAQDKLLLGMPVPTTESGPFAARAFRDALIIEWQPIKQAVVTSTDPALQKKHAAFEEIFKLLAYVPETGVDQETAERLRVLANEIDAPERIAGVYVAPTSESETQSEALASPLENAPGTAVLPKTEAETPRGFTAGAVMTGMPERGNTPEVVISAFDKERHETMRKMQALREKEDTPQGRKWFARFGAAALLALLATPTDNGKDTQAGSSLPPGVTMIDSAWPTGAAPTTETAGDIILPDFTIDNIPTTTTPDKPAAADEVWTALRATPETASADVEPEVTVMSDTDSVMSPGVDAIPVVESVSTHLYTFDGARGLNGKVIDTVSEAAFDEWQRNRSLLSKPITATQFLATMWSLLSELEKNPDLQKKLTAQMQIDSGDIHKVFTGTQNAIDLQPFYKLLESRI